MNINKPTLRWANLGPIFVVFDLLHVKSQMNFTKWSLSAILLVVGLLFE